MPLSPSQMTSRASAAVGATRAMRRRPAATCVRVHSAPLLVLPNPRPARHNQTRQSPGGGFCSSRAQKSQSCCSSRTSAVVIAAIFASHCSLGREAIEVANETLSGGRPVINYTFMLVHAGVFPAHSPSQPKFGEVAADMIVFVDAAGGAGDRGVGYAADCGIGLNMARLDLVGEMQLQCLLVDGLAGLGIFNQPADFFLGNTEAAHCLDIAALVGGGGEFLAHWSARAFPRSATPRASFWGSRFLWPAGPGPRSAFSHSNSIAPFQKKLQTMIGQNERRNSMTKAAKATTFSSRSNAKRAAEKAIADGIAPSHLDYRSSSLSLPDRDRLLAADAARRQKMAGPAETSEAEMAPNFKRLMIIIEGNEDSDLELMIDEIKRLISEKFTSGSNHNETASFFFDIDGYVKEKQLDW
jgi:hypothetical protein